MAITNEKIHLDREKPTHTETHIVPWSTAVDQGRALLGGLQTVGGVLQYIAPAQSSVIPGLVSLNVEIEPYKNSADATVSNQAKLTVTYGKPEFDEQDDDDDDDSDPVDIGEESLEFAVEEVDLPKGGYKWSSDDEELGDDDAKPRLRVPLIAYQIKIFNSATLPKSTINGLIGKVNDSTFRGFDSGTVLFEGTSSNRKFTSDGAQAWELTHKFAVNANGWQKLYRASAGAYEEVVNDNGDNLYEEGDLNGLL